jgi:8-oxo-dGTP pyrophosphatase MutT (NUDIX family)
MVQSYLSTLTPWTRDIRAGRLVDQAAALCQRVDSDGKTEILLVTSRDSKRWVLPKGAVEKKESSSQAAAREAFEEAGVTGAVQGKPLGRYVYVKPKEGVVCLVTVHRILVEDCAEMFSETGQRIAEWVSILEAARRVDEPELKSLIASLA